MTQPSVSSSWSARAQALAQSQDRYLLILALAGLFYCALDIRVNASHDSPNLLRMPLVGIEFSSLTIWATAPIVLGFLLLAVIGAFRARRDAYANLRASPETAGSEELPSTTPELTFNILDAVIYTSASSPRLLKDLLSFTYPIVLTVFWIEATVFWFEVLARPAGEMFATTDYPFWRLVSASVFRIVGFLFILAPIPGLRTLWRTPHRGV